MLISVSIGKIVSTIILSFSLSLSRRAPEWKVSAAALKARPSDRVCALALPRMPAADWQPDRPLLPTVSTAVSPFSVDLLL